MVQKNGYPLTAQMEDVISFSINLEIALCAYFPLRSK